MAKICVAGGGPAGLLLAAKLAEQGFQVHLFEKKARDDYGKMHDWSDALEIDILHDAGLPVPRMDSAWFRGAGVKGDDTPGLYERHRVSQLAVFSPDYSERAVVDADFRHVLVDRHRLRDYQIAQAERAGVVFHYGCAVTGLLGRTEGALEKVCVTGLRYRQDGAESEMQADLVVEATGQVAEVRALLGAGEIAEPFNQNEYGYAYRTVRKFDPSRVGESKIPFVEHYRLRSDRGYLFVHFHDSDIVDIGGGARDPVPNAMARQTVLDTLEAYPQVSGEELRGGEDRNLKCMPPDSLAAGGILVVGHAGAQINPTQGCGIASGYSGALLAAQVIREAEDFGLAGLWAYNHRWFTGKGAHYAALYEKMKRIAAYTQADLCFLLRENIMNGQALTNDYHGHFVPLDTDETRRLRDARPRSPETVDRWIDSYTAGKAVWDHYQTFPQSWDRGAFDIWRSGKRK